MAIVYPTGQQNAGPIPHSYNIDMHNAPHGAIALGALYAGTKSMKIAWSGDSTTQGLNSQGNMPINLRKSNVVASRLAACGFTVNTDNILPFQSANDRPPNPNMIDTRVSFTGTWDDVFHGSNQVTLRNNNCWGLIFGYGAASLTFTPVNQINQIDIWYYAGPAIVGGTPHFTVQVDNGTPQDVYPASNLDMQVLTLNVALGAHSVTINWVSGPIYLGPILCRNTNLISIEVINVGMGGLFASNQANMLPGYSVSGNLVARLQADVYIVNLMMNDILFNASVSSSKSSLQAYINQLLANGNCDVIMEFPNPAIGNSNLPLQPQYRDAFFDIANQMQVPLLDLYGFLANGDPNVAAAMGTNAVHPIGLGYNNIGRFEFNVLRSLWGF